MFYLLNTFFLATGITLMIASDLLDLGNRYVFWGYADEVFCAVCLLLLVIYIIKTKRVSKLYSYFSMLVLLGLSSNLFFGVQKEIGIIALDTLFFLKPYIVLLYMITIKQYRIVKLYKYCTALSKTIIIILSFFSVASLFFEWNMRNADGEFKFLSTGRFTGTVAMWTIIMLTIVVSNKKNNRLLYAFLSALVILMTNSGLGKLSIAGLIAIYFFIEKKKKFRWYYLLIIFPICVWVGQNEIMGYLVNPEAPRFVLFYYSFVTAFRFFPLGSGFGTYASVMANRNYSVLYYEYGFTNRYGMNPNQRYYLLDSYYPQIIGQFGLIGSIVFGYIIIFVFNKYIWKNSNKYIKNAALYLFATWAIAGLGFGSTSSWSCAVFFVISLLYSLDRISNLQDVL